MAFVNILIISVTLIVVAVPEGMCITRWSLSHFTYSIDRSPACCHARIGFCYQANDI